MRHGWESSEGRLQSHVRADANSRKIIGAVKVWLSGGWSSGSEEDLLRRIQNEGRIEHAVGTEVEVFVQKGKGNFGVGVPAIGSDFSGGDHAGDGWVVFSHWNKGLFEQAGPPSSVRGEIKFEIVIRVGCAEKKLGDVILPKLGLKFSKATFGMKHRM